MQHIEQRPDNDTRSCDDPPAVEARLATLGNIFSTEVLATCCTGEVLMLRRTDLQPPPASLECIAIY